MVHTDQETEGLELKPITNKEISLYQEMTQKIKLQNVWNLLGMTPHSGQRPVIVDFDSNPEVNNYVVVLGRRAQPLSSSIHTPTGFVKFADIKIGDTISKPDGGTQKVTDITDYAEGEVYEVTLGDGRKCRADSQHLFEVIDHHGRTRVLPLDYILKYYKRIRRNSHYTPNASTEKARSPKTVEYAFSIKHIVPIESPKPSLPINPYLLGLLLGDGCITGTNISLGMCDRDAIERGLRLDEVNLNIREARPGYHLVSLGTYREKLKALELLGKYSNSKFIPFDYLNSTVEDRLELLRGLMDTDGAISYNSRGTNTTIEYSTCSPNLRDGVKYIVESLGGSVRVTSRVPSFTHLGEKKAGQLSYRLYLQLPFNPFWIERKASKYNKSYGFRGTKVFITDITYIGKEPVRCITVDSPEATYVTDDFIRTHNSGKSLSTSVIALRELLVPFSNTILITPSYKNSKILFNETIKHVKQLKLPIKSINKNSFTLELENGSTFGSYTATNFEAALGSRASLLIFDETQSIPNVMDMLERILMPMLLDYGTRANGVLFGRCVFLGTPRESGSEFHNLFLREKARRNWKSYNSPSTCNPLLPREYIEAQREILPELVFRNEILAEFVATGTNVFHTYSEELNLYDPEEVDLTGSQFIVGLDFGYQDSTAAVLVFTTKSGDYYVADTYQKNLTTTKNHVKAFKHLEERANGILDTRYGDPSAAQLLHDLRENYDYDVTKAFNRIDAGLSTINTLMSPQGYNRKPKLYINKNLGELRRQIMSVTFKENVSTSNQSDPFNKDPEGTHWDLLAAFRYAVATHYRQQAAGFVVF